MPKQPESTPAASNKAILKEEEISQSAASPISDGEREELEIERENSLKMERENRELKDQLYKMQAVMEQMMARMGQPGARVDTQLKPGQTPVFDPDEEHGTVWGDTEVAYVQCGHQFGRDRRYIRSEENRGSPKAFNPRLIGVVKLKSATVLDGFRDKE